MRGELPLVLVIVLNLNELLFLPVVIYNLQVILIQLLLLSKQ